MVPILIAINHLLLIKVLENCIFESETKNFF